ncbi:MAG: signal peptide peptidase SppA [Polyangiaceae bacterium]
MNHQRTHRKALRSGLAALSAALVSSATFSGNAADYPPARQTAIPTPGRSIAANDQSSAISTNPANLGFLATSEARWTWYRPSESSLTPARGHAFDFALSLPWRIGTGLRLDVARPGQWADYSMLTWALGIAPTPAWSMGLSIAHTYSDLSTLDGANSVTLAASFRPSPFLALSVVGRDLNQPESYYRPIDRSVDLGIAIRPTGRRSIEIGLEQRYLDRYDQWIPRATLGIDVPHVGRIRGDISTSDIVRIGSSSTYVATAGLEVGIGTATVEGGGVFGSGLGPDGAGFYTGVGLTGYRSPGIPEASYAQQIRIEETPGARGHVHLLRRLWRLAADKDVKAVALVLKTEPASSLAHAEELGDAIRMLRANGKKVICHLEDAGGRSLYVCSQADRVVMNPAGVVRFAGLRTQYQYYGALLGKLGIKAQFVRIGAHKTAPEAYMRDSATDVARADHIDLLHEYEDVFMSDIGGGRRISRAELNETFAHGPFVAKEAEHARLVDGTAFDDEIEKVVGEVVGHRVSLRDDARPKTAPERFGAQKSIAMVYVEGDMVDGKSRDIPLIGTRLVGSYTVAKALKTAREDPKIGAVVMRVETPGGSSLAADIIWREAVLTSRVKPLIVSMGTSAASGGYYIASAGSVIYANPLTITGSIGIFYGKADVSELFAKIGVNTETYKTSPRADGESMYRPYTEDEIAELQKKVHQLYEVFLDRVAEGRKMSREAVDAVGQGRVWTGRQAYDRKLVDHLGGIREALDEARRRARLPEDAPIVDLPVPEESLLGLALKLVGGSENPPAASLLPSQLMDVARAMAPFTIFAPDEPLARMEYIPLGDL